MKEELLHAIWKYQLVQSNLLHTTQNEKICILYNGQHNDLEGPDFHNAKIQIGNQLWFGHVEIHIKSSDWYVHRHHLDANYDVVILHVVWEHDTEIFTRGNQPLPTLELKKLVSPKILKNFNELKYAKKKWIPCEHQIQTVDKFTVQQWQERLLIERLEYKSTQITKLLIEYKNDWEAVLFLLLAQNFGMKQNAEAFLTWAQSMSFTTIRKVRSHSTALSALFFGQAGLLDELIEDPFYIRIQEEYAYLKKKHQLQPISHKLFRFYGIRPHSFPTIRMAQLAAVYHQHSNLFSKILSINTNYQAYELFRVDVPDYWLRHYTFTKSSPKRKKRLSKNFIDLLLINTIIPLQFAYNKAQNKGEEPNLQLLRSLSPENNSIIQKFEEIGVKVNNAFDSQALLELKKNYCTRMRCLECAIGLKILKSTKKPSS